MECCTRLHVLLTCADKSDSEPIITACASLTGPDSTAGVPAQPRLPPAADFRFFASLALPLLAALQRPPAPAAGAAGEHRKAKRRRQGDGGAADGVCQTAPSGGDSLSWTELARSAGIARITLPHTSL